jgi:hypothetical protein
MKNPLDAVVYIPLFVAEDPTIPNGDKETIIRLLSLADRRDRYDIDAAELARILGVTPRTMKKRLARLEERDFLTVHDGWIEIHPDLIPDEDSIIYGPPLPPRPEQG